MYIFMKFLFVFTTKNQFHTCPKKQYVLIIDFLLSLNTFDWEELQEKIIRFYICVLDENGNGLTTYEDFSITKEEWIKLGEV